MSLVVVAIIMVGYWVSLGSVAGIVPATWVRLSTSSRGTLRHWW